MMPLPPIRRHRPARDDTSITCGCSGAGSTLEFRLDGDASRDVEQEAKHLVGFNDD